MGCERIGTGNECGVTEDGGWVLAGKAEGTTISYASSSVSSEALEFGVCEVPARLVVGKSESASIILAASIRVLFILLATPFCCGVLLVFNLPNKVLKNATSFFLRGQEEYPTKSGGPVLLSFMACNTCMVIFENLGSFATSKGNRSSIEFFKSPVDPCYCHVPSEIHYQIYLYLPSQMSHSHAVKGNWGSAVKTSAGYNWRNTRPNSNCNDGPTFIRTVIIKGPQGRPKPVKAWDLLEDFEEFNGGSVTLCEMPDENQILLKVPRHHNMYSFDMKTPSLTKDYACLIAKATCDESKLWHRRDFGSTNSAGTFTNSKFYASEENRCGCIAYCCVVAVKNTEEKSCSGQLFRDCQKSSTNSKKEEILTEPQQEKEASFTDTLEDNPKILAFRRELEEIALNEPVNTGKLDPDDSPMPKLKIFHKSETGIFDKASYDEEGVITGTSQLFPQKSKSVLLPTLRIHNIHPKSQILGDPKSAVQTRSKVQKKSGAHALFSYIQRLDIILMYVLVPVFKSLPNGLQISCCEENFKYLKGQTQFGLWYPRESPFDMEAFSDSDEDDLRILYDEDDVGHYYEEAEPL
ncbi:hypothetical protein Tco_1391240 [Tanacetum coccineum]